jgi:cryptochrome 1
MSQEQCLDVVICWFRRDLRCYDNPALIAALNSAKTVIPLYIWSPEEEGQFQPGRQTRWWNKHSVLSLARRLEQLGSALIIRRARDSAQALKEFIMETGAQAVFFNHLYDSISMVRDQQVKDDLRSNGILVQSFNADLLYEPWEVLDDEQQPYTTFKSFWDRCLAMPYAPPLPLPEPTGPLPAPAKHIKNLSIHEVDWFMSSEQEASTEALTYRWDPAGQAAVDRLEAFLDKGLPSFEHDRAKTDRESTTMLSPWIHFGSISVRHIYYRVAQKHAEWQAAGVDKGKSCLEFLQQMGYREYSRYLAFHFPFITERSMLAHLRAVPWRLDQSAFKAWRQGLTGYPLVDAGMRQLWSMGWCHNRVRVVASHFMVKHLLLPWQWGLKHLWDCQIDADLECDALGWQYVSGCLSDAHPFSYMVDLEQEWKRFDPDGHYVRRWLPVLSQLPTQYIHQPWKAPPEVLEEAGVELGLNYPWPIITPEAAKEGVALASQVVERCATGISGSSGSSSGTGYSLMPCKEPYRAPTDPGLMSSFLAASREGSSGWQERLPPLYIHSATGHPLSLLHSAQQRPIWGPSLRFSGEKRSGGMAGLGSLGGYDPKHRCYYGLHRGPMGQQQLMLGPAAAAAAAGGGEDKPQQSGSASASLGYTVGISTSSEDIESEAADNSAALMDEDVSSGSAGLEGLGLGDAGADEGVANGKRRKQQRREQVNGFGAPVSGSKLALPSADTEGADGDSSEQHVVPSASEEADTPPGPVGFRPTGWQQQLRQQQQRLRMAAVYEDAAMVAVDDEDDDDGGMSDGFGAYPAVSATTAWSGVRGQQKHKGRAMAAKAPAGADDDAVDQPGWGSDGENDYDSVEGDNAQQMEAEGVVDGLKLVAEAARLQELELQGH